VFRARISVCALRSHACNHTGACGPWASREPHTQRLRARTRMWISVSLPSTERTLPTILRVCPFAAVRLRSYQQCWDARGGCVGQCSALESACTPCVHTHAITQGLVALSLHADCTHSGCEPPCACGSPFHCGQPSEHCPPSSVCVRLLQCVCAHSNDSGTLEEVVQASVPRSAQRVRRVSTRATTQGACGPQLSRRLHTQRLRAQTRMSISVSLRSTERTLHTILRLLPFGIRPSNQQVAYTVVRTSSRASARSHVTYGRSHACADTAFGQVPNAA